MDFIFLTGQGYAHGKTVICQGNKGAIFLDNNGKPSRRKRTKHINIRYILVKYCYERGEFDITHWPTENMTADYFT